MAAESLAGWRALREGKCVDEKWRGGNVALEIKEKSQATKLANAQMRREECKGERNERKIFEAAEMKENV